MVKKFIYILYFWTSFLICQNSHTWKHYTEHYAKINNTKIPQLNSYYLIETAQPSNQKFLQNKGIKVIKAFDRTHFIVCNTYNELNKISDIKFAQANSKWKLTSNEQNHTTHKGLYTIKSDNTEKLVAYLKQHRISINKITNNYIQVHTSEKIISNKILPLLHVTFVSTESFSPIQELLISDYNLHSNQISTIINDYPELNGEGFSVGIKDNKPFDDDLDVGNKIISSELTSKTADLHATIMSSIIAGVGISGIDAVGIVPKATLFSSDFKNLSPDPVDILKENKAYVQNHSYGTKIENFYGLLAAEYDQYTYENPEITHVFSSGNSGGKNGEISNLTGNFKMAKNIITVGSINNLGLVTDESSKGPAFDGRIKPEIVAYSSIGTSNAAALVSGVTQKLQQFYFNKKNEIPPSYLIKALLLNGATDVNTKGIDFKSGFGNLNAATSLNTLEKNQYFLSEVDTNAPKTFKISIPENTKNLKIMLVWNDIAANPNDNVILKNDLDLIVNTNDATSILPWIIVDPLKTNSDAPKLIRAEDHLNTVEQITIENTTLNEYNIQVKAESLQTSSQKFALVYSYELKNQFSWIFPNKVNSIIPTDINTHFLRWNASYEKNIVGTLQIDYDSTNNWLTIAKDISLNSQSFLWSPPIDLMTRNARLRFVVTNSETSNLTSEPFQISNISGLQMAFNCPDQFEVKWNKQENTENYEIYGVDSNTSELIKKTIDTFAVINKTKKFKWFYMTPKLNDTEAYNRSNVFIIDNFPQKCYYENLLLLQNNSENTFTISAQLNSLYEVDKISLFKNTSKPTLIETRSALTELIQTYQLTATETGEENFFFEIELRNGTIITSDFILKSAQVVNDLIIFPNPVKRNTDLEINANSESELHLFDLSGKILLKHIVQAGANKLSLNFPTGTYILIIIDSKSTKTYQKIIIN